MKTIAKKGLIVLFSIIILFHLSILTGIIPYTIVWGGRLNSDIEMYRFEAVSLFLNTLFLIITLIKANSLKINIRRKIVNGLFWVMGVLFFLNTIGNLFSKNYLELIMFTPLTALLCVFSILVALEK